MKAGELFRDDFKTVGELIEHLKQFDSSTSVYVSTRAGGGITAALRQSDEGELIVCFYGKNGGEAFNPPLTDEYYEKKKGELLNYLSDSRYRCETKYHGGECVVYKCESSFGAYVCDRFNKLVIDRMKLDGLLPSYLIS